jgi:uncharacterized protein YecT (DUF1311 family)
MTLLSRLASLVVIVSALAASPASAHPQHDMNAEAALEFAKADQELNEVYVKVLGVLDEASQEKLKKSQRAWVAYRDAEAGFSADAEARGGSMWPAVHESTRARLTKERVRSLRELLIEDER